MSALWPDARVLWHLVRGQRRAGTLEERLERFYAPQADRYDAFRERLLHGRKELIDLLDLPSRSRVVELGGGTGRNLEFFGDRLAQLESMQIVDLCPSLLEHARKRAQGLTNVSVMQGDACTWKPAAPVDAVLFSYALTMIPDWFRAVDNALSMLRPGGRLCVVDFYVSRHAPAPGLVRHGTLRRVFWPLWLAHDGVFLSPDQLPYLMARCDCMHLEERFGTVPYLPSVRIPYYLFVGRVRSQESAGSTSVPARAEADRGRLPAP
jgi:S-adenosylmethionine-diacylgycerolhomoserine-N-methlytransferase